MWNCRLLQLGKGLQYLQERMGKNFKRYESDTKEKMMDGEGSFLSPHCGMAHVRLAVQDLEKGGQPMSRSRQGRTCTHVFSGRRTL